MVKQHHNPDDRIGGLSEDAPALHRSLLRVFDQSILPFFERGYALACQSGGLDEYPIERPEGASFNPRPARICSIVLKETKSEEIAVLVCALLLGSKTRPEMPPESSAEIHEAFEYLVPVWQAIDDVSFSGELGSTEKNLAAAVQLDLLRHFHMTRLPKSVQLDRVNRICEHLLPKLNAEANKRMQIMLQTIVERVQKRLALDE